MYTQDPTTESLAKQVKELSRKVAALEVARNKPTQLDRNLDNQSRDILQQEMSERALDIVWNDYFYLYEIFNSLDGWADNDTDANVLVSVSASRLFIETSASGAVGYAHKKITFQNTLSFNEESRFGSSFDIGSGLSVAQTIDNVQMYLGTGVQMTGGSDNILQDGLAASSHYGFYIDESTMYGVASDGTNYTQLALVTGIRHFDLFFVEARHYPGTKVTFYVSEPTSSISTIEPKPLIERGSISTTLPSGRRYSFAEASLKSLSSGTRNTDIGFFEIAQRITRL